MSVRAYPAYRDSGVAWIGDIPAGWQVLALKHVVSMRSGDQITADAIEEVGEFPVFGGNGLRGYTAKFTHDGHYALIGRQGALCGNINYALGRFWASEHAVVVTPKRPCAVRWLGELLRAMNLGQYSVTAAQPGLAVETIGNLAIPLPSPAEQSAIAAFLDREAGKIDALVAEQERLMALLKEKRQAVISQAVTKGLNPNAKMKPSGVEWLGDVPAHWTTQPLKRLIAEGSSISYGIVQPGEPQDEGVPFVQTTNMSSGTFVVEELQRTTPEIASAYPRSRLNGGEVILGIRASIGAAYVVPTRLAGVNLSRGVARIECGPNIDPAFLVAYLRSDSVAEYWALAKQGSTFNEVSIETVRDLVVPVPPVSEQRQVASDAASQDQTFMALIGEAGRAVALLKERRAALISAAVTGKIDVRDPMTTEAAAA